jgi:hypothetical protein
MKLIWVFITIIFLVGISSALPTTGNATNVGNNEFTLSATGCDPSGCWFEYGIYSDRLMVWTNTNLPVGGFVNTTESGAPIETSMTYYAAACDTTGCGNVVSFTTLAFTPLPSWTLGKAVTNMTQSKFNILYIVGDILIPYAWTFPENTTLTGITIVCGLMFFFLFVGLWLRQRGVAGAVIIGLLVAPSIMFTNRGLNLGIPVEFQAIAQALLYASLAGIFLIFLKK